MGGMTFAGALGLLGVILYIAAYAALQLGLIRGRTYLYAGTNLAAAACVLFSLTENYNQSSALIQIMWIVISVVGMVRLWFIEKTLQFTETEQRLLDALAPGLPKDQARRLLDLGKWRAMRAGEAVIEEGESASFLGYLDRGAFVVSKSGVPILSLGPGAVVGEMTYLDGSPATARVDVLDDATIFCVDAEGLRRLIARNDSIANALERSVARTLRSKLQTTSEELRDVTSGFVPHT